MQKQCSKCKQIKDISEFHKNRRMNDGLSRQCKTCVRKWQREYSKTNQEKRRKWMHEWYIRNADKVRRVAREYKKRKTNEVKRRNQEWYQANRDRAREQHRRYYETNKVKILVRQKQHYAENKERYRAKVNLRRARKSRNGGSYTAKEWRAICEKQNNCCLACGKKCRLTVDHVIPLEKGGSNTADNLQGLCQSCNSKKGTRIIDYRPKR